MLLSRLLRFASSGLLVSATTVQLMIMMALSAARAQDIAFKAPNETPKGESLPHLLGDRLENLGLLYENDQNEVLQELWLLGRYHGQYYWARGTEGSANDYETRRTRFGGQARVLKKLTLHAQAITGSDWDPVYNGFTELWAQWAFSPQIALTIGQQKHRFTHDRNVSSRYLNYLERAMLTNMFGADYTPAVTIQGTVGNTSYYTGVFSNATGTDMGAAFTELNSGHSFLAAAYHNLGSGTLGADSAHLHATYVNSEANERATNFNRFQNGFSSAVILTKGSRSLVTEATAGVGSTDGNAYGINIQPGWFITNAWQLVGRYQYAFSNDTEGLSPQRRYERLTNLPQGDQYQAGYLGLDYYLAKHRLKIMHGIEYSSMSGEHVWTASSMVRFYFGPHSGGAFPMNQMLPGTFWESD
jgi:phosphate-selective porin OprO/OprP